MAGVPEFGKWDNDVSVPYTQYFEQAHKRKGGAKGSNSKNSRDANDSNPREGPANPGSSVRTKANPGPAKATAFSAPYDNASGKPGGMDGGKGPGDFELGAHKTKPECSVENSPLNQHSPGRVTDKAGSASPWQSKTRSEHRHDHASTTPGRSKLQQLNSEKVTAIPKFGDWDASDPSGGAVYTQVFKKVKDEKREDPTKDFYLITEQQYSTPPPEVHSRSWLTMCFKPTVYK